MVRKLLKHDLYALFRVLGFVFIGVFVFALAGSAMIFSLGMLGGLYEDALPIVLAGMIFYISIYAFSGVMIAPYIVVWVHYYRSLFSRQGYLTHSLPATPTQLLWSKLLSSFIVIMTAYLVSGISMLLLFCSFYLPFGFTELGELYAQIAMLFVTPKSVIYLCEFAILGLLCLPTSMLVVDAIITLGQLFNSRRLLFTFLLLVGTYFLVYGIVMVASIVLITVLDVLLVYGQVSEIVGEIIGHVFLVIGMLFAAGLDVGSFFLIRYLLTRKVNLLA